MDLNAVAKILARHLATILVAFGMLWTVGKPHAQQFIEETVDERLDQLEVGLSALQAGHLTVQREIQQIQVGQEEQQRTERTQQDVLLQILREVQRPGG